MGFKDDDDATPKHPNKNYNYYFDGQNDDCFRIGVSVTRTTLNLYTSFTNSDIIVASPLGLRLITGTSTSASFVDFRQFLEPFGVQRYGFFLGGG